jgi:hypothetical protein
VSSKFRNSSSLLKSSIAMFLTFMPLIMLMLMSEATNKFALENKLGEGGYGLVYKVSFFNL